MTHNPNENQAEKHSAEPWRFVQNDNVIINNGEIGIIAQCFSNSHDAGKTIAERDANAARIVECVNFCAGYSNKDLKNFRSLLGYNLDVKKALVTLQKELEAAKKAQEWVERWGENALRILQKYKCARNSEASFDHVKELRELLNNGKDGK